MLPDVVHSLSQKSDARIHAPRLLDVTQHIVFDENLKWHILYYFIHLSPAGVWQPQKVFNMLQHDRD